MPSGAVTEALTVQLLLAAIEPPERLIVPAPAFADGVPAQFEIRALGAATVKPAGKTSVNATPASPAKLFGFAIEKLTVVEPNGTNLAGVKTLLITGGDTTVRLADAVLPSKLSSETTVLVTFNSTPGVPPKTGMLNVQDPPAGMVAPVKLIKDVPETALITPPPQLPVTAPATVSPAGKLSVKLTPVRPAVALGLVIVKPTVVVEFKGIEDGRNALLSEGEVRAAGKQGLAKATPPYCADFPKSFVVVPGISFPKLKTHDDPVPAWL